MQDTRGYTISDVLTLVVDREGAFCDLEMILTDGKRIIKPPLVEAPEKAEWLVRTNIGDSANVTWFLGDALDTMVISLSSEVPKEWVEIREACLYLGINHQGELGAIVCRKVEIDPDGVLQSSWPGCESGEIR